MELPRCDHKNKPASYTVCRHILDLLRGGKADDIEYCVWFDGQGAQPRFFCFACTGKLNEGKEIPEALVCQDCFEQIDRQGFTDHYFGEPVVPVRSTTLRFVHENIEFERPFGTFIETCPVSANTWLFMDNHEEIKKLDTSSRSITSVAKIPDILRIRADSPNTSPGHVRRASPKFRLQVSVDGSLILIVNDHSPSGAVLDASTGEVLLLLDRDSYYHNSNFPAAFATIEDRTILVHATNWNRLDLTDPRTGELLTPRESPNYQSGKERPEHYLDYYHAGLYISPDQQWIVDWGWVWAPVGLISAWNIHEWLNNNVWESEDGPTKQRFCQRAYNWDEPLCWLDDRTLCVWGHSDDDLGLYPAVTIYDVVAGEQIDWFVGPPRGKLVYDDGHLFCFSEEYGMSVWDIKTGECLYKSPDFQPVNYNRHSKQFLCVQSDGTLILSHLET